MGPNGAGKSTLLALVGRMLNPQEGQILIDGQNIAEVSLTSLRRTVGMVSADLPLMRGTLEKNLRYRWPDAPQEEIHRVTVLCGVDEIITALPRGIKTRIQEDGRNLSLGQRQRIKLARALVGNPKILLLDEFDANLDPCMNTLMRHVMSVYEGTVLMVTHRLETAANADVIWHIADGRLLEIGCPRTLLASGGPTARLFHNKLALAS
jgi:ABC-type multidrug transport system fused ATPase/permease subunit